MSAGTAWSTNLAAINADIKSGATGRFVSVIDAYTFTMDPANPDKFKGAESLPLGTITGISAGGTVAKSTQKLERGSRVNIEASPGSSYVTSNVLDCVPDGSGKFDVTLQSAVTAPDGAAVFGRYVEDGTHLALYGILDCLNRWPQSDKAKLYPVV